MTSRLTYSMYIQDQQAILQLWAWCHQGAKKVSFTACHLGKLQLACTRPQVISTSPKPFLISRIDYNPSVIGISPQKSTCPWGKLKEKNHQPNSKIHQRRAIGHCFLCTLCHTEPLSECEAEVDTIKLPSFSYRCKFCWKKNYLHKNNMIYIIKKEGLYQNKVNSSLDCNCEIGYYCFPFSCRCRCSVCLYYGLHLHVLNNQQKSD